MQKVPKFPVLFMHGLFDNAQSWIISGGEGEGKAIPYQVADANLFDVWIMSWRGVEYSRKHTWLSPDTQREFWNFDFEDFGGYDLRACIEFIQNERSDQAKISLIGYSEGTTSTFFAASEDPEYYQSKLNVFIALAPVGSLKYVGDKKLKTMAYQTVLFNWLDKNGYLEIYGKDTNDNILINYIKKHHHDVCDVISQLCQTNTTVDVNNLSQFDSINLAY